MRRNGIKETHKVGQTLSKANYSDMGNTKKNAYIDGTAPAGLPGWPYTKIHLRESVIVNNVQYQVDQLYRQTLRQLYVPPKRDDAVEMDEVDQNGPASDKVEPYEGSPSSDSD